VKQTCASLFNGSLALAQVDSRNFVFDCFSFLIVFLWSFFPGPLASVVSGRMTHQGCAGEGRQTFVFPSLIFFLPQGETLFFLLPPPPLSTGALFVCMYVCISLSFSFPPPSSGAAFIVNCYLCRRACAAGK
jgi:hypothetical protein